MTAQSTQGYHHTSTLRRFSMITRREREGKGGGVCISTAWRGKAFGFAFYLTVTKLKMGRL